jgi:hypothetical protein
VQVEQQGRYLANPNRGMPPNFVLTLISLASWQIAHGPLHKHGTLSSQIQQQRSHHQMFSLAVGYDFLLLS